MKINCLVKTLSECQKGFDVETVAHEVNSEETVGEMMDRLAGWNHTYKGTREYDSSILVELRVARTKPKQED